jgi:UDP-glucose 4-epimerase
LVAIRGVGDRPVFALADIADAHVKALNHLLNGGESGALNLANARGFSVKEVIAAAQKVCGRAVPYETAARRRGDPPVLIGDAGRARSLLGWQPEHSDLATQIEDAWKWMQARQ